MPIRPEMRKFYGKEWLEVTRPRILRRANHCCEACGVPNHQVVARAAGWWVVPPDLFWFHKPDHTPQLPWTDPKGNTDGLKGFPRLICRQVYIVLTIAHLNHTPGDDRDENLKALCQYCHLLYDERFHRQTRCIRKDAGRPLLTAEAVSA